LTTNANKCGRPAIPPITTSKKAKANRIVSGWQAKPHSLPWMVYLEIDVGEVALLCAGSLVDNGMENQTDIVVTAAHCVFHSGSYLPPGNITAIVGAHDVDKEENSFSYLGVRNYVSYFYNYDNDDNDITLLRLSEPVQYTKYVSPICLPTNFTSKSPPEACFGAGWGKTKSMTKLRLRSTVNTPLPLLFRRRKKRALCADNYYKNDLMCEGDSGSPLFCEVEGRYYLFGILSAGPADCKSVDLFRLHYIRVDTFYDWIMKSIEKLKTAPDEENRTDPIVSLLLPKISGMKGLLPHNKLAGKPNSINGMNLIAKHYGYFQKTV
ncbi:transmembrane serine protease 8, partial [Trichuris trichiura]